VTPGDRHRLLVTAWLVYGLFLNPVLVNPVTWSALDAAASPVETERWPVVHADLYAGTDGVVHELWSRPMVTVAPAPEALAR
jgi:hypothetical protein